MSEILTEKQLEAIKQHKDAEMARAKAQMPQVFEMIEEQRKVIQKATLQHRSLGIQPTIRASQAADFEKYQKAAEAAQAIIDECARYIADYLAKTGTPPPVIIETKKRPPSVDHN
jgi:hypothetical protein